MSMITGEHHAPGTAIAVSRETLPALAAETQRAKTEIEAALTIAAARPRDERMALDRILNSCQRPSLAERAQYSYSRGGTEITGPTIDLLEVVAQHWGNLEFGFRELARFPGVNGAPGESLVEAFAWDLQSNTRRRTQFTVIHAERTKKGVRLITDPRDIYEWIANNAQRRVRTALENIIPRDVVEEAAHQCEETLKTTVQVTQGNIAKMVERFAEFSVTKDQLETRIQRRIDTITPAQFVSLRKIYASLRDGMSKPGDWFSIPTQASGGATIDDLTGESQRQAKTPETPAPPEPTLAPDPAEAQMAADALAFEFQEAIGNAKDEAGVVKQQDEVVAALKAKRITDAAYKHLDAFCVQRRKEFREVAKRK